MLDCCFEAGKTKEVQFDLNRLLEYQLICKTVVVVVVPACSAVRFTRFSLLSVQFNPFSIWTVSRPGSFKKIGGGWICKRVNHLTHI